MLGLRNAYLIGVLTMNLQYRDESMELYRVHKSGKRNFHSLLGIDDVNRLQKPSLHLRDKVKKIVRFVRIYSVMRVIARIAGRYRPNLKLWLLLSTIVSDKW